MYIPAPFGVKDEAEIEVFLEKYDFATLVSAAGGLTATHVPVLVRREASGLVVVGHMARANAHWRRFDGASEALLIFQGPHGYVSPTWYASGPAVPTWNYAVVHAYGEPRIREDPAFVDDVLRGLVDRYEGHRAAPWRMENLPDDTRVRALGGIVAFEMPVRRLEAKFKLGQNRAAADRAGTIAGLEQEGSDAAANLAAFMRAHLKED